MAAAPDQVDLLALESVVEHRLRHAAGQGYGARLIVLVAIRINHEQDLVEIREDGEQLTVDQLRVTQRDISGNQRFRIASFERLTVEAHPTGEIADEVQVATRGHRMEKQACGQQGCNRFEHGILSSY